MTWDDSARPVVAGLGLAGLAPVLATIALIASSDTSKAYASAPIVLLIGLAFVGSGVLAWLRRPQNRTGMLMTAVGLAWFLASLGGSDAPLLHTLGMFGGTLWGAFLIHAVLAFPSGELSTRAARIVVMAAYAMTTVLHVPPLLFSPHESLTCDACVQHLGLIESNSRLADALFFVQLLAVGVVVVAACVLLASRWMAATGLQRRTLAPVLLSGGATGALVALSVASDSLGLGLSGSLDRAYLPVLACVPFAFLGGLLRSRLRRGDALSNLVDRFGAAGHPQTLRRALADALGDPSPSLAFWLPERECYVDAAGRAAELPLQGSGQAATAIERSGDRIGAIIHDASLSDEVGLVRAAGAAAALELENERLDADLRVRLAELRASPARIVEAGDSERRRIERDLHDGVQQRLVSLLLSLKLERQAGAQDSGVNEAFLDEVEDGLAETLAELRRIASGILPPVLSDHGLGAAVEELAGRSAVEVVIDEMPVDRLPQRVEVAAYFVIAEALTNVAKYARARQATVSVSPGNGSATIEVRDDGVGGADPRRSGLRGLADRVGALDGRLALESPAGGGTTVRARIPCAS